uniref:Serine/arginine repetitive matrix protein 1 n=1 Tax=Phascolarctos cinereus TaxID=38626 RepID=A0A6P5MB60_PHACI|nr:serine/arginine repetitive matrix protein 1 [Phascolarctos cinereus]
MASSPCERICLLLPFYKRDAPALRMGDSGASFLPLRLQKAVSPNVKGQRRASTVAQLPSLLSPPLPTLDVTGEETESQAGEGREHRGQYPAVRAAEPASVSSAGAYLPASLGEGGRRRRRRRRRRRPGLGSRAGRRTAGGRGGRGGARTGGARGRGEGSERGDAAEPSTLVRPRPPPPPPSPPPPPLLLLLPLRRHRASRPRSRAPSRERPASGQTARAERRARPGPSSRAQAPWMEPSSFLAVPHDKKRDKRKKISLTDQFTGSGRRWWAAWRKVPDPRPNLRTLSRGLPSAEPAGAAPGPDREDASHGSRRMGWP